LKKILTISLLFLIIAITLALFSFREKTQVKIYFYDYKSGNLRYEERDIDISYWDKLFNKENIAKKVISLLLEGPKSPSLRSPIPKGTRLLRISIRNNIAYVSFSNELKNNHPGGSTEELLTIYSIVNTLTELPWIKKVQILVGDATLDTLAGHYDISVPLERNMNISQ